MSDFEQRFETYLQGHIHPEVQPLVRRAVRVGQVSMEGFLDIAGIFQANHEAFDRDLDEGGAQVGWTPEGEFVDSHAPILERTPLAQQDFEAHRVDL